MRNAVTTAFALICATVSAHGQAQSITPSPGWSRAMPSGPDMRVKITEEYAKLVGRDAYFWAWPMVNMFNRRLHFMTVKEIERQGPLMEAPLNRIATLAAAKDNPKLKAAMTEGAIEADTLLVKPLFQFRNYGQQLPYNWSTISNEAAFGTDYFTRTAVAKSNILVNSPNETKYFYQDLDANGGRLNNANRYTVIFAKDATPPVNGFWSLSIYNEHHFFIKNAINRFSVGTKNEDLKFAADGSLTIYVQAEAPADPVQRANWLPSPKGDFSLYVRSYWPKAAVTDGSWTPPAVIRVN